MIPETRQNRILYTSLLIGGLKPSHTPKKVHPHLCDKIKTLCQPKNYKMQHVKVMHFWND